MLKQSKLPQWRYYHIFLLEWLSKVLDSSAHTRTAQLQLKGNTWNWERHMTKHKNNTHTPIKRGCGTLHNIVLTQTFCSTLPLPPLPGLSLATAHLCCCCYDKMKLFEWSDAHATQNKLFEQPTVEATHTPPQGFPYTAETRDRKSVV